MTPRRKLMIVAATVVAVGLSLAGIGLAAWWLNDNIGAPGPGATGSGPCTSSDAVNIQMVFVDGHTVQACTRDRPACPNQTISGGAPGEPAGTTSKFGLTNQLRSASRRYIFSLRFDDSLPAETTEQRLLLSPGPWMMPGAPVSPILTSAALDVTPRDPIENAYVGESGTLTVSSTKGVARGRIDGKFSGHGPTRPDRPAPSTGPEPPQSISGTFACTR